MSDADPFAAARAVMIREQLQDRGIKDARVLDAMARIPRHAFVPDDLHDQAYADRALPIDANQTISQPYIVGLMSQLLRLQGNERVLEIGTGSGYQTAILCKLAREIYSIEQSRELAERASERLNRMALTNVRVYIGDGGYGLPEYAPYDAILCAAAAPSIPDPLRLQLSAHGGRMILPIGDERQQNLMRVERRGDRFQIKRLTAVRFVPLIGQFGASSDL